MTSFVHRWTVRAARAVWRVAILVPLVLPAAARSQSPTSIACQAAGDAVAHVRLYERWVADVWRQGNIEAVTAIVGPTYVRHETNGTRTVTSADYAAEIGRVRRALPDIRFETHDCAAVGDRLWVRWTMLGTDAQSGNAVRRMGAQVYRIENGRFAETWILMTSTDGVWPD